MNKKTFLAATIITIFLISLSTANIAKANFMPFPQAPTKDPPLIIVETENHSLIDSQFLNFTLVKPNSWTKNVYIAMVYSVDITSITYNLDGQIKSIEVGRRITGEGVPTMDALSNSSQHSISLSGLKDGQHSIQLNVTAQAYFDPPNDNWIVHNYTMIVSENILITTNSSSEAISFTIDAISEKVYPDVTPPKIVLLSPTNSTYEIQNTAVKFNIDEPITWISYSLDNLSNTTITGNTSLTRLSEGLHSIIVYANDTAGNVGKSNTVVFGIEIPPTPTPSISPSLSPSISINPTPSPTEQPTLEPSPTVIFIDLPRPTDPTRFYIFVSLTILAIAVAGVIVYFKKIMK